VLRNGVSTIRNSYSLNKRHSYLFLGLLIVSCNRMFASSHGRRHLVNAYGVIILVWLIGAVACVVAATLCFRTIGSCQSTATSYDCTARLVAALPRNSAIEESDLYLFRSNECICICLLLFVVGLISTHVDGSCRGMVSPPFFCVCLFVRVLYQKPMQIGSSNLILCSNFRR